MQLTDQRYHLTLELLKLGTFPDKTLIDRLVVQHFPKALKQREDVPSDTLLPSLEETAANAIGSSSVLSSPTRMSDTFEPHNAWDPELSPPSDLESNLLNLEFAEDTQPEMHSPLYISSFIDSAANALDASPKFDTTSAFQDKRPAHEPEAQSRSIDPQLVLPDPAAADESLLVAPRPASSAPEIHVKREPSPLEPIAEYSGPTASTFTAFTPMRLDATSPTHPVKPSSRAATPEEESMRPSLEEYNKLSSKEKRQLRNKISARNFRNRRKEYITLLEEQVQERDKLIDNLRDQIASLRLQNTELTNEVRVHQSRTSNAVDVSKLLGALQRNSDADAARSPGSQLLLNTRKDVSPSPRPRSPPTAFWGGVQNIASSTMVA